MFKKIAFPQTHVSNSVSDISRALARSPGNLYHLVELSIPPFGQLLTRSDHSRSDFRAAIRALASPSIPMSFDSLREFYARGELKGTLLKMSSPFRVQDKGNYLAFVRLPPQHIDYSFGPCEEIPFPISPRVINSFPKSNHSTFAGSTRTLTFLPR